MNKTDSRKVSVPLGKAHHLLHPYNACLVSCKGKDGRNNVMAAAWIVPISVKPPLIGVSIRPERHSHSLIVESGEFVVNVPTLNMARQVLFCGRKTGRDHDKMKEASLSCLRARKVSAPAIRECVAHLECRLARVVEVGDHNLIIGEVVSAYALKGCFDEVYDITVFRPCLHIGKNFFTTCTKRKVEPRI